MPRYRFQWENLPEDLLSVLAEELGLENGDPIPELRRMYGARPKDVLVKDTWPALLRDWLPPQDELRPLLVRELVELHLGAWKDVGVGREAELAYLGSLRNAATMRSVVLSYIHRAGEIDPGVPASVAPVGAPVQPTERRSRVAEAPPSEPPGASPPTAGGTPPAGWFPDPWGASELRWWDGSSWTGSTSAPVEPSPAGEPAQTSSAQLDDSGRPDVWRPLDRDLRSGEDLGPSTLRKLLELWVADEEWMVATPRHVRWWPFPIPVDLRASDPGIFFGDPTVKVEVDVRLLAGSSKQPARAAAMLAPANLNASAAATWFDPGDGSVHVTTTYYPHAGNRSVIRVYSALALMGVIEASLRAHELAALFESDLLIEPHPASGIPERPDEILEFIAGTVAPTGMEPNKFAGHDFEATAKSLWPMGFSTGGDGGLTAEFPFTCSTPVMIQVATGVPSQGSTTRYEQFTDQPHPSYGAGLLCVLSVPLDDVTYDDIHVLANDLNRVEATQKTGFSAWGAWCPHAADPDLLAHVTFVPSVLADPGIPFTLAGQAHLRTRWAQDRLLDPALVQEVRSGTR